MARLKIKPWVIRWKVFGIPVRTTIKFDQLTDKIIEVLRTEWLWTKAVKVLVDAGIPKTYAQAACDAIRMYLLTEIAQAEEG